jgi:uncharacterized CHY-type Zn-finger protein
MQSLPAVAKNFYYACKKCETDRYHRVLAHLSSSEAKIECEVCGSKKKLNIGNNMATKKKSTTSKAKAKKTSVKATNHLEAWNDLKERFSDLPPEIYTIRGNFTMDMVIDHPTFGIGIVTQSQSNKIDVCFEEGVKTLMHRKDS